MFLGIIAAVFIFFFISLTRRRVHARRCDQYLVPLVKVQNKLADSDTKKTKEEKTKQQQTADAEQEEPSVPVVTIDKVYKALRQQQQQKEEEEQNENDGDGNNNNMSSSSAAAATTTRLLRVLPTLPQVETLLSSCPTVTVSLAGQRVVWTRSATLMRRVLFTHFRIFPGPATKQVVAVANKLSSNNADVNVAAFLEVLLNRANTSSSSSSSGSSSQKGNNRSPLILDELFRLVDGEQNWDQVTWLGGFKPGEMPDIPGLLLRGMVGRRQQKRQHQKNNSQQQSSNKDHGADDPAEDPLVMKNLSSSSSSSSSASASWCPDVVRHVLLDLVGDRVFAQFEHDVDFSRYADEDAMTFAAAAPSPPPSSSSSVSAAKPQNNNNSDGWVSAVSSSPLVGHATSSSPPPPSSSAAKDILLCASYAFGLSPYSFIVSKILAPSPSPEATAVSKNKNPREVFEKQLVLGVRACVESHVQTLADPSSSSLLLQQQQEDGLFCGIKSLLLNCGRSLSVVADTDADKNSGSSARHERWDSLLRQTISNKSAVVAMHLMVKIIEISEIVLAQLKKEQTKKGGGNSNINSNSSSPAHLVFSSRDEFLLHIEGYVREALRLNPAVGRCVRVADGDDPQPGQTFGIPNEKVLAICGTQQQATNKSQDVKNATRILNNAQSTTKQVEDKLDPSIRLSNNGYLCIPSSACVVCDIAEMMRCPHVWGVSPLEFQPNRWNPAAAESKRRQELDANFAPFGFGAAAELATRYVIAVVSEVLAGVALE